MRLVSDKVREATADEVKSLKVESSQFKEMLARAQQLDDVAPYAGSEVLAI